MYATHFHPQEPILASCSADFTLKIWVAHLASKRGQAANPNPITLTLTLALTLALALALALTLTLTLALAQAAARAGIEGWHRPHGSM